MGWTQAMTLMVAVITGAGAVVAAAVTYGLTQRAGRREQQAKAFAKALTIIEEYANMPRCGRMETVCRWQADRIEITLAPAVWLVLLVAGGCCGA